MPLHLDYRPGSLEELRGNDEIKNSLASIFTRTTDRPRAFLFVGASGCGKTTTARIVASLLKCGDRDVYEYNAANSRGVDTIREITQSSVYHPFEGKHKVYIMDEAARLTRDAQSAFLKLLEDTPPHVTFILCTTDPENLLNTIRNRCVTYEFKPLKRSEIVQLLKAVLAAEEVQGYPDKIINEIAKQSEGCPRQALVLLESVIDIADDDEALKAVKSLRVSEDSIKELCQQLVANNANSWHTAKSIFPAISNDPEKSRRAILSYLGKVLISKSDPYIHRLMSFFLDNYYDSGKDGLLFSLFSACNLRKN